MTRNRSRSKKKEGVIEISQNESQNLLLSELLKMDHIDLSIGFTSLKPYRAKLRRYMDVQFDLSGIRDRISLNSLKLIGKMSKSRQTSIGYTPSMASIIKKYVTQRRLNWKDQYILSENKNCNPRPSSEVNAAKKQREAIRKSSTSPYAIKIENLSKELKEFLGDYRKSCKGLRESTTKKAIREVLCYFGYVHSANTKEKLGDEDEHVSSILTDSLVDIITIENIQGMKDFLVSRNEKLTKVVVTILRRIYSLIKKEKPWLSKYINPLNSRDQSLRELSHRNGRRGLLTQILQFRFSGR